MRSRIIFASAFVLSALFLTGRVFSAEPTRVASPDGALVATFAFDSGSPSFSVAYNAKSVIAPSPLELTFEPGLEGGVELVDAKSTEGNKRWSPTWGETETIEGVWRGLSATLREREGARREFRLDVRAYDGGLAYRYFLPRAANGWKIVGESALRLDPNDECWPLTWTEATYPEQPVKLSDAAERIFPPLTFRTPDGVVGSLLEASGDEYPRALLKKGGDGVAFELMAPATVASDVEIETPWRVLMVASDERTLVERESFLYDLTGPSALDDVSWIVPGKTISNEGNCDIKTDKLTSMVDFAASCGMKYVQIDWGWYGTEWRWSEEERDKWAETNPEHANDPDWRRNCDADPYQVAKGLVPYLPTWKSMTVVDLDLPKLVEYGRSKGVGICLYVNDRMLKANDLEKLFAEYERWGLAGLKPGFVAYGDQANEESIKRMVAIAARHKLWLCVHDSYLPNGYSSVYPNLMSVEGGGGQEGRHPAWHDVTLPFGRSLAGPFDYTPALYVKEKSKAHQLSLLVTIYNPAPVLRGGWAIRDAKADDGFGNAFGDELEFLRKVETEWTRTRVLDAKIGEYIVVARRSRSGAWHLGATNGQNAVTRKIALDFLEPGKKYKATFWRDADEERDGWRPTVREETIVDSTSVATLELKERGGAVAVFEEVK